MLELARPDDWESVNRLSVQIHDLHAAWRPDIYFHCDAPYAKEEFLSNIADRRVYVAKVDDIVSGYLVVSIQCKSGPGTVEKRVMRLDSICVDEALRGRGIGKEMVRDAKILARAFGCNELILGVHPENDDAIIFYQKCGFRIRTINMDLKL